MKKDGKANKVSKAKKPTAKSILGFDPKKGETHLTRFEKKGELLTVSQPVPFVENLRLPKGFLATSVRLGGRIE